MNNIISIGPLAIYDALEKQHRFKPYAYGQISPLVSPKGVIPPFQFIVPSKISLASFSEVIAIRIDSDGKELQQIDLTSIFNAAGRVTIKSSTKDTNIYLRPTLDSHIVSQLQAVGYYYLKIVVGQATYYSEIWASCQDIENYLKLTYTNSYNLTIKGHQIYFGKDIFEGAIYLNTELGRPEYAFEETVTERLGYSYIENQVSKKRYRFSFIAPEYLLDALRIVRLCNIKTCTTKEDTYDMLTFSIEPTWEEQGDLASVEAEFEVDNIIANLGGSLIH